MPAVRSGRMSASVLNALDRKNMPTKVTTHARHTAPRAAPDAMFCGRLNEPPPIIEPTTTPVRSRGPSCLFAEIFSAVGAVAAAPAIVALLPEPCRPNSDACVICASQTLEIGKAHRPMKTPLPIKRILVLTGFPSFDLNQA